MSIRYDGTIMNSIKAELTKHGFRPNYMFLMVFKDSKVMFVKIYIIISNAKISHSDL